jgi:hypothetical protein
MNPQDARSPLQQQRWIEVRNVGSYDIPAFGVVEVTDSTEPDGTESRTVFHVRRPTEASMSNVLFNGSRPIPVSGYGAATGDFPAWALSGSTVAGTKIGTQADSYELSASSSGFVVLGGSFEGATRCGQAGAGNRGDIKAKLGGALNCDSDTTVTDAYSLETGEDVTDLGTIYNADYFNFIGRSGDNVLLKWDQKYLRYFVAQVYHHCQSFIVHVWDTTYCLNQIGRCISVPMMQENPVAGDPGCTILEWVDCNTGSGSGGECDNLYLGTPCNKCEPET